MKIRHAIGYDEIQEVCKDLTMEQFIQKYADEMFEEYSEQRKPDHPFGLTKALCFQELDVAIQHWSEDKDLVEFYHKVKQVIQNKQE